MQPVLASYSVSRPRPMAAICRIQLQRFGKGGNLVCHHCNTEFMLSISGDFPGAPENFARGFPHRV
jgi:hypothetical protein